MQMSKYTFISINTFVVQVCVANITNRNASALSRVVGEFEQSGKPFIVRTMTTCDNTIHAYNPHPTKCMFNMHFRT